MDKSKIFYTDGACSGNPGAGGWCYVDLKACDRGYVTDIATGGKKETTNNEMELTAVYKALVKALKSGAKKVTIYSDSAYVVNAIAKGWLSRWNVNGWKTKDGKDVKNKHIWEKMIKLLYTKGMAVTMVKVAGHKDDPLNELADKCAVKAREELEG